MLQKIKHNKLKNTGLIYEALVRKIIDQAVNNKPTVAYGIFNRHFKKSKELSKQLELYTIMLQSKFDTQPKANAVLQQILRLRMNIDQVKLQQQRYMCIKQLKKRYDVKKLLQTKINYYKLYASIYKIFESLKKTSYNPINIVQSKHNIIQHMMNPMKQQKVRTQQLMQFSKMNKDQKQRILTLFVQKFNEKYSSLSVQQKDLLKKYAYNMSDTDAVHQYMDKEIDALKKSLYEHKHLPQVTEMLLQADSVKQIKNIQDKIYAVLNMYEFQRELNK